MNQFRDWAVPSDQHLLGTSWLTGESKLIADRPQFHFGDEAPLQFPLTCFPTDKELAPYKFEITVVELTTDLQPGLVRITCVIILSWAIRVNYYIRLLLRPNIYAGRCICMRSLAWSTMGAECQISPPNCRMCFAVTAVGLRPFGILPVGYLAVTSRM